MRRYQAILTAAGVSPWFTAEYQRTPFSIGFGCSISSGASLTYSVQHSFDDPSANLQIYPAGSLTRSTTTATLTYTNHNLVVGDSLIIRNAGAPFDGTYTVAGVTNANVITFTVANSGATTANIQCTFSPIRVFNNSVTVAQTTSTDGNYAFNVSLIRAKITSYSSGQLVFNLIQGGDY